MKKYFFHEEISGGSHYSQDENISKINKFPTLSESSIEVNNFHKSITKKELKRLFRYFGYISNFYIKPPLSRIKDNQGVIIRYGIPECAIKAACFLEKKIYLGKILEVKKINNLAFKKLKSKESSFNFFKKLQYNQRKTTTSSFNSWVSLFDDNKNIFKRFTDKYGEKKINDNMYYRSRLLLSQGRIRAESISKLKKEGVSAENFSFFNICKKSRHCFFIKFRFFREEFFNHNIFIKFGGIRSFYFILEAKFVIIEYKNRHNANIAFKHFQNKFILEKTVLIEWIPLNYVKKNKNLNNCDVNSQYKFLNNQIIKNKNVGDKILSINCNKGGGFNNKQPDRANINSKKNLQLREKFYVGNLIIRNLPFKSNLFDLKRIFSKIGKILSVRLPKKKDGTNKGFAFIVYQTLNDAKKALLLFQNTKIGSRNLKITLIN